MPNKKPVDGFGIKYLGTSNSWDGCFVKFWMHDKGWEYKIDGAMLYQVKNKLKRGPGLAFNFCKKIAIETYGPYDSNWKLIEVSSD